MIPKMSHYKAHNSTSTALWVLLANAYRTYDVPQIFLILNNLQEALPKNK